MRKVFSASSVFAGVLLLFLAAGCKTEANYAEERAENAALHFQKAKYRELQTGEKLSLRACIEEALKNNLTVRVSEREAEVQKEFETAEALGMLPQLNINNNFTARSKVPASGSEKLIASGKTYGASYSEDKVINYLNIDLMFSMLDFGLAYFNTRQQADRVLIHRQITERTAQNLIFDVVRAYFKVAAAQRAINMTNSLLEQCRSRYEQIYKMSQERKITPIRAFDESRRFIAMEKRLTGYQRGYENACIELRTLMGYYPNADIVVDESVLDRVPNWEEKGKDGAMTGLPTIDLMEQIAVMQRPELYETDMQKHINILECRKTILMMFPNVRLYADWSNSNNSFLYNKSWWELGLRAAYNLLKVPQSIAKVRADYKQIETEEMRSYAQAIAVMAQVRIAYGNLCSAKEKYKLNREVYTAYDENLQAALKNRAYGGSLSQLEVDHIRLETTQASIDSLVSLGEYYIAYYRLLNMMGVRKFDFRTQEELKEELQLAAVRAAEVLAKDRNDFENQKSRGIQQKEELQRQMKKRRQTEADTAARKQINAEIDARIKAESRPVSVK